MKRLNSTYLPAPTDKNVFLDSIKNEGTIDIAQAIDYLNFSTTSINLAYAVMMQKTYMVIQALTVLIDKDPVYKDMYITRNMSDTMTLSQQLKENVIKINTSIDTFSSNMDRLYIGDKNDIFRSTSGLSFTAGTGVDKATIDLAGDHCEIIKYVPSDKFISMTCTQETDFKNIDYKHKFSAYLNDITKGDHVFKKFMNFNYDSNISDNERFTLNYDNDNFYTRDAANGDFKNGSWNKIGEAEGEIRLADTSSRYLEPFQYYLDDKTFKDKVDGAPLIKYGMETPPHVPRTILFFLLNSNPFPRDRQLCIYKQ